MGIEREEEEEEEEEGEEEKIIVTDRNFTLTILLSSLSSIQFPSLTQDWDILSQGSKDWNIFSQGSKD